MINGRCFTKTGYEGATKFRSIINKVKPGFPAPEIVKPLVDLSVELGGTAIFEVNAKDETELTYQWQFEVGTWLVRPARN